VELLASAWRSPLSFPLSREPSAVLPIKIVSQRVIDCHRQRRWGRQVAPAETQTNTETIVLCPSTGITPYQQVQKRWGLLKKRDWIFGLAVGDGKSNMRTAFLAMAA
jgi:hypothetical protein